MSTRSWASATAQTIHSYDTVGRTADLWQCTPYNWSSATIWNMHNNYDLGGDLTSWTNASGTTFTQTISHAQRITQTTSSKSDLAQNATGGLGTKEGSLGVKVSVLPWTMVIPDNPAASQSPAVPPRPARRCARRSLP